MFFTWKNCMFSDFTWKKNLLQEMVGGGVVAGTPPPWLHFPYGPEVIYNFSIKSAHNKDF